MNPSDSTIKLARQVLASHKAKLATATDKDQVRRQIRAAAERLTMLEMAAR